MYTKRAPLHLVCLALVAACAGDDAPMESTDTAATTAASASSTTGTSTTGSSATSAASTITTTTSAGTSATATSTSESDTATTAASATTGDDSTSDSTDSSTDSDSGTDTGTMGCAPSWVVPSVDPAALAAHDLAWVECGLTACGPEDAPEPGEPSVLCAEITIADAPLEYLGLMHLNATGAFTTDDVISNSNFAWLGGQRHVYKYGEFIYIATEGDEAVDQLDVFFAVRALELLRTLHADVYQELVGAATEVPAAPVLQGFAWKNRLRSVVISFDTSPNYIAAGLTILDAAPIHNKMTDLDEYANVLAISVDRETIRGSSDKVGSRPIYGKPSDDENFLRYLREGLVETIVHELLHPRVDRLNSVDAAMNDLYNRRVQQDACARFELEEALVAATSLVHFREAGGVSDLYLDYYDVVLDANLTIVGACPEAPMWSEQFSIPSDIDPRYDLRLVDLH